MISIFIAICVFRYFQKIAVRYKKSHWQIGLVGMGIFIFMQVAFNFVYKIFLDDSDDVGLWISIFINVASWCVSIFTAWCLKVFLEQKWKKDRQAIIIK